MMEMVIVIMTRQKMNAKASFCRRRMRTLHSMRMGMDRTGQLVSWRLLNITGKLWENVYLTQKISGHVHCAIDA